MPGALYHIGLANLQGISLHASAARTATGTGDTVSGLGEFGAIVFQLDLTAAATAADDTFDCYVQTTIDGTNWVDIHHFTQMVGNGGAKRYFAKVVKDVAVTEFENATALAAGASRSILGDKFRVRWVIVDANTVNASFTFSVLANAFA